MIQKVIRTGNSLAVTIPSGFVKSVGIKSGDQARVELEPEFGKVTYFFLGAKQLPLLDNILTSQKKISEQDEKK